MQTDTAGSPYVPGADENPLHTAEPLTLDDLTLLSDLFHLPYEHGPTARTMLRELDWLKSHSAAASADTEQVRHPHGPSPGPGGSRADGTSRPQAAEWRSRAQRFDGLCEAVVQMFHRLSNAPNRSILYDLYNYICDIKAGVALARTYVKGLGEDEQVLRPDGMEGFQTFGAENLLVNVHVVDAEGRDVLSTSWLH